jgi:hypothetical protein
MHPATCYHLAPDRIADPHHQTQRDALARAAGQTRRRQFRPPRARIPERR